MAVRGDLIAGFIPSLQTFADLAVTPVTGWKEWLTLLPPVDARGPLVALPWVTGLLGSAATYGVARRFRSVGGAAVAPVVLLVGSIALGTQQPAAKLVQGVLFALVLILWLVVRAGRTRAALQNGAGRQARTITGIVLLVVAALAGTFLGQFLPGTDESSARTVVRDQLTPPYDVAQFTSPLSGFRRYTEPNSAKLFDTEILKVTGLPDGTPLRFATLDSYDGLVWGAADRAMDGTPFQQVGSRIAPRIPGDPVTATVTVPEGGYEGAWLPVAGSATGVRFEGARGDDLADALWLNTATETAVVPALVQPGDTYSFDTVLAENVLDDAAQGPGVESGGQLAEDTSFLDAKLDAWSGQAGSSWEKFVAVAKAMTQDGAYTDGGTANSYEKVYLPGHGLGRLGRFVGSTQLAGNDEQYAATLALVGNRLGIPTRVVMGAIPESGGVVKGKDVHAWVEVQEDNGTWHALLPSTFLPDRNKKPNEQQLKSEEQKVGAQVPPPAGVNPPSVLQGPGPGAERHGHQEEEAQPARHRRLAALAQDPRLRTGPADPPRARGIRAHPLAQGASTSPARHDRADPRRARRGSGATSSATPAASASPCRGVPPGSSRRATFPESVTAEPIAVGCQRRRLRPGRPRARGRDRPARRGRRRAARSCAARSRAGAGCAPTSTSAPCSSVTAARARAAADCRPCPRCAARAEPKDPREPVPPSQRSTRASAVARAMGATGAAIASTMVVVLAAATLGYAAVTSQGATVHEADVGDGGVWITSDVQAKFGRLNKAASQLDAGVAADVAPGSGIDVLQDGTAVVAWSKATAQLQPIDVRTAQLREETATAPGIPDPRARPHRADPRRPARRHPRRGRPQDRQGLGAARRPPRRHREPQWPRHRCQAARHGRRRRRARRR